MILVPFELRMPAFRMIICNCLWRALLVTFALYAVEGVASAWDGTPVSGCEPETKPACVEPDTDDTAAAPGPIPGTVLRHRPDLRLPACAPHAAFPETGRIKLIRGPPGGMRIPA